MKIAKEIKVVSVDVLNRIDDSHDIRDAIPVLEESLRQYGIQSPIVIDAENNIVAGNAVYQAAVNLGYKELPCVLFEGTPEEMREYRLADNKTSEFASWNDAKLKQELSFLTNELNTMQFAFDENLARLIGVNNTPIPTSSQPTRIIPGGDEPAPSQSSTSSQSPIVGSSNAPTHSPEEQKKKDDKFREELRDFERNANVKPTEYIEYVCSCCGRKVIMKRGDK